MDDATLARVPLQVMQDCVVASLQVDLSPAVLQALQEDLLELLHSSGAKGAIVDLSGVQVMDGAEFRSLRKTLSMAALLGARCFVCGLQPGVVAALTELGADLENLNAALNLDDAFRRMKGSERASGDGEVAVDSSAMGDGQPDPDL